MTAVSAFCASRRGFQEEGEVAAFRCFGMRSSTVPASVSQAHSR